jgi:AbiTii
MTSLIDEVLRDAASTAVSVSTLLRKALIVAKKLDVPDVPQWIEKELSGYAGDDTLPTHRVVQGEVKAKSPRGWISVQFPTNKLEETISRQKIYHSVAQIEAFIHSDDNIAGRHPAEALSSLRRMYGYKAEFMCFVDKTNLQAIIDEIRTRILQWALDLDKAGIRGEGMSFTGSEKEKAQAIVHHYGAGNVNVGVIGPVAGRANIAAGDNSDVGGIDGNELGKLVNEIRSYSSTLQLSVADQEDMRGALAELDNRNSRKLIEPGIARRGLERVLHLVGGAGETIVSLGIKAAIEVYMKQNGLSP